MDVLKNRIDCINAVRSCANVLIPAFIEEMEKKAIRSKVEGGLFKRDKERVDRLLSLILPSSNNQVQVRVEGGLGCWANNYRIYIKSSYQIGDGVSKGVEELYRGYELLSDGFTPLPLLDVAKIRQEMDEMERLLDEKRNLDLKIYNLMFASGAEPPTS